MTSPLRIGIVGGGNVGVHFSRDLCPRPEYDVVGIVTRSKERQQELANQFGYQGFSTLTDMLEACGNLDVVCVVNANHHHKADTLTALEAGCHVYLEKPMAPTLAECKEIVEAAETSSGSVQVGFEYIHGTMTGRIKQLIGEGYFGDVQWLSVVDSRGHWWAQNPYGKLEDIWKLDREKGGGIIFHCGIHQLDCIRNYVGRIATVQAFRPPVNPLSFYPKDVPANVTLMLTAESGAVINFQVMHDRAATWYREKNYTPDYVHAPGHEFNISVIGTKGSCDMRIYDEELHLFKLDADQKENRFDRTELFKPNPHDKSHHDMSALLFAFLESVAAGEGAVDSVEDAYETMCLAYAAEDAITRPGDILDVADYR